MAEDRVETISFLATARPDRHRSRFRMITPTIPKGMDRVMQASEGSLRISFSIPAGKQYSHPVEFNSNMSPASSYPLFTLLPVELKVDANRDGEITTSDQTTESEPYRFWINNDTDNEEDTENPATTADSSNNTISTQRDLEDFTRVWFNIGGLHDQLKSGDAKLGFKWTDASGSPSLKLYWAADPEGGRDYLTDEGAAVTQIGGNYGTSLGTVSGGNTTFIDKKVFANIDSSDGWVYFLYEGVSEGSGKLTSVLEISGTESEAASVDLKLLNVRKMYERVKVTPDQPDSFTDPFQFVPNDDSQRTALPPVPAIGWVWDPWNSNFIPDPQEEKKYMVFVHGWRMTYRGAQKYGETMFKRLWQEGYKGRYAFVRWPTQSAETHPNTQALLTYNTSDYRAWKSGKGVAQFVNSLPTEYTRNIAAHSMGNIVVSSAIREGLQVDNYGLLNAAIPAMCYDPREALYAFDRETPDGDPGQITKSLGFKSKIGNTNGAELINFFLTDDSALGQWELNNRLYKPLGDALTGYRYVKQNKPGERVYISQGPGFYRWIRDAHESMAFATASRTKTVGSDGRAAGSISDKVDMDARYGFGETHSAEWLWRSQKTNDFYFDLIEKLELKTAN